MDLEIKQQLLNVLDSTLKVEDLVYAHFQELGKQYALTLKASNPDDGTEYQTFYFKQTEFGFILDIRTVKSNYFAVDIKDDEDPSETLTIAMRIHKAYALAKYLELTERRLIQPELNRLEILKDPVMFKRNPNLPVTLDTVKELNRYPEFNNLLNAAYLDSFLMAVNINELNHKHINDYDGYVLARLMLGSVLSEDHGIHNFTSSIKYLGCKNDAVRTHVYSVVEYEANGSRRDTVAYIRVPELIEDEDGNFLFNEGHEFKVEFGKSVYLKSDAGKLFKVRDEFVKGCRSATGVRDMTIYKEGNAICPTA